MADGIAKAAKAILAKDISGNSHHENLIRTCVKHDLWRHSSVRASQYGSERSLCRRGADASINAQSSHLGMSSFWGVSKPQQPVGFYELTIALHEQITGSITTVGLIFWSIGKALHTLIPAVRQLSSQMA
jgi:hypothetical protein